MVEYRGEKVQVVMVVVWSWVLRLHKLGDIGRGADSLTLCHHTVISIHLVTSLTILKEKM